MFELFIVYLAPIANQFDITHNTLLKDLIFEMRPFLQFYIDRKWESIKCGISKDHELVKEGNERY